MVGLRKQAALILTIITIVAFTLTLNIGNVYALTFTLTPNSVMQGVNVVASGSGYIDSSSGTLQVFSTSSCVGSSQFSLAVSSDGSGNLIPVNIPTASLSVGDHCAAISGLITDDDTFNQFFTVTAAPPIPEYPFGLAVLAVFMIIAYGVIRRKTRNDYA